LTSSGNSRKAAAPLFRAGDTPPGPGMEPRQQGKEQVFAGQAGEKRALVVVNVPPRGRDVFDGV